MQFKLEDNQMYTVTVIQAEDAKFIGDFEVVFSGVASDERSRRAIAWQLRDIAKRLEDDPKWLVREAS